MTTSQRVLSALLDKYPTAGSLTLAKIAYRDNRALFTSQDAARSRVRYLRGARGAKDRKYNRIRKHMKPCRMAGEGAFESMPDGLTAFADWKAHQVEGPLRALVLSDIHSPYHNKEALVAALRYGLTQKADMIFLNGDIMDHFACSFWETDPNERNFRQEIKITKELLRTIRDGFPGAKILFKKGNHEERYDRYMRVRAPELLQVEDFKFKHIYKLRDLDIEMVDDRRPVRLGKLNILHGHEYKFPLTNPVNPARGFFLRAKTHCLGGHLHQTSQHSEKDLEERVISTWSTGCLCDVHPEYRPLNNWNLGFAFVEVEEDGNFEVRNLKVIHGKIYGS